MFLIFFTVTSSSGTDDMIWFCQTFIWHWSERHSCRRVREAQALRPAEGFFLEGIGLGVQNLPQAIGSGVLRLCDSVETADAVKTGGTY